MSDNVEITSMDSGRKVSLKSMVIGAFVYFTIAALIGGFVTLQVWSAKTTNKNENAVKSLQDRLDYQDKIDSGLEEALKQSALDLIAENTRLNKDLDKLFAYTRELEDRIDILFELADDVERNDDMKAEYLEGEHIYQKDPKKEYHHIRSKKAEVDVKQREEYEQKIQWQIQKQAPNQYKK